jgi:hypothetical protein
MPSFVETMSGNEGVAGGPAPAVTVHVRVRPLLPCDVASGASYQCLGVTDSRTVTVATPYNPVKEFTVHRVHDTEATDEDVFDAVGRAAVKTVIGDGSSCAIVAYGQTNTGKTHTWRGLLSRSATEIYANLDSSAWKVFVSCLQLHNDQVTDLLPHDQTWSKKAAHATTSSADGIGATDVPNSALPVLPIREDPSQTPTRFYVERHAAHEAGTPASLLSLLQRAERNRTVAMTRMNVESSRSHVLFTVHVVSKRHAAKMATGSQSAGGQHTYVSDLGHDHAKLCHVDLAGSERVGRTKVTGPRLLEAQFINSSLSALGNVVHSLAAGDKAAATSSSSSSARHIPFRDSKLTKLLQDYLGLLSSRTVLILTLSPSSVDAGETMSVLKLGERATCIPHRSLAPSRATSPSGSRRASRDVSRRQSPTASRGTSPSVNAVARGRSPSPSARVTSQGRPSSTTASAVISAHSTRWQERAETAEAELHASREREAGLLRLLDALEAEVEAAKAARSAAEGRSVTAAEQVIAVTGRADKIARDVARVEAAIAVRDVTIAELEDKLRVVRADNDFLRSQLDTAGSEAGDMRVELQQLRAALREERDSKDEILAAMRIEAAAQSPFAVGSTPHSSSQPRASSSEPTWQQQSSVRGNAQPTALTPESVTQFLRAEIERRTKHVDRLQERVSKLADDAKTAQQRAHCDVARAVESQRAAERGMAERDAELERTQRTLADTRDRHAAELAQREAALEELRAELSAKQQHLVVPSSLYTPHSNQFGQSTCFSDVPRYSTTLGLRPSTALHTDMSGTAAHTAVRRSLVEQQQQSVYQPLQPRAQDRASFADPMSRFAPPDQGVGLCRPLRLSVEEQHFGVVVDATGEGEN